VFDLMTRWAVTVEVTQDNQFRGAGIFEAYSGLVQSVGSDAESETERVLDITFGAIGAAASTVGLVLDPIGTLLTAGVGWLIEHVSFLREPLDMLMGDPDEIQRHVDGLKKEAEQVRQVADEHAQLLASFQGWTGQAGDAFRASMDKLGGELAALAETVDGTAKIAAVSGVLVVTLRDIVRDLIATLFAELIRGALIAAATAIPTFGGSIAAFVGYAAGRAAALGAQIASRIARLLAALGRQGTRLAKLGTAMADLAKNFGRLAPVADVAGVGHEVAKAGGAYA
jgi:uncharacterized protein YukE